MKEGVNINDNNISQILDIADRNSTITDMKVEGNIKYITLTKILIMISNVLYVVLNLSQKVIY